MKITASTPITTMPEPAKPPKTNPPKWETPKPGDTLTITVQKGDTKFALARRYADDANHDGQIAGKELTSFFQSLDQANGGNTVLKLGGTVRLPSENVDYKVRMAIAVQAWLQEPTTSADLRKLDFDWTKMSVGNGPLDSWIVEVPTRDGSRTEQFMAYDDMSDDPKPGFGVQLFSDWMKEFEAASE